METVSLKKRFTTCNQIHDEKPQPKTNIVFVEEGMIVVNAKVLYKKFLDNSKRNFQKYKNFY